jgi:hypothetical protein
VTVASPENGASVDAGVKRTTPVSLAGIFAHEVKDLLDEALEKEGALGRRYFERFGDGTAEHFICRRIQHSGLELCDCGHFRNGNPTCKASARYP